MGANEMHSAPVIRREKAALLDCLKSERVSGLIRGRILERRFVKPLLGGAAFFISSARIP
jgi:hypothetical protein